jgi:hypothetical protein
VRYFAALMLLAAGCSDGTDGAVSVRWHIVDLTTGANYDPRLTTFPSSARTDGGNPFTPGSCGCLPDGVPGGCPGSVGWEIDQVQLRVVDPATGALVAESLSPCNQREATTPFNIPTGRFALSLAAFDDAGDALFATGVTPAPTVRTILPNEIVNLDVVEIGVHPNPLAVPDGGTD